LKKNLENRGKVFLVGDIVKGCTILEIKPAKKVRNMKYRVRNHCCGREHTYCRQSMVQRFTGDHDLRCQSCAAKAGRLARGIKARHFSNTQIYVDGWGWTLGAMGIRAVSHNGERQ